MASRHRAHRWSLAAFARARSSVWQLVLGGLRRRHRLSSPWSGRMTNRPRTGWTATFAAWNWDS